MSSILAELIGTAMVVLFGNGVVANVCLNKTKGEKSGWLVITTGWAMAVILAVLAFGPISGGHFNPAVTLAMASIGKFSWSQVPIYIGAQIIGAMVGAGLVYVQYYPHWKATKDADTKLACFATMPAIKCVPSNFASEFIGTFVLIFAILGIANTNMSQGLSAISVGFIIWAIGLSLGGTTGYAINPARDFGPRIMHALLPIPDKGDSGWQYAWIPIVAPIMGGIMGAVCYRMFMPI